MSFGLSLSDIKFARDGVKWVLENFFDKNNSPDQRYKGLENDVKDLDGRLNHLYQALDKALKASSNRDDAFNLRRDLENLIGDFRRTIEQAQEILNQHVRLQRNNVGIIDKVIWVASGAHDKVDALRRDIQFHSQKIYLVIEPVNLNLLTTIGVDVAEILSYMRRLFPPAPLPSLPRWLDIKFTHAAFENSPRSFRFLTQLPLSDGFDALYLHFRESTYAFRDIETAAQTPEQYLNLLKCQWLLETLRNGDQFRSAHPGSLFPRTLAQMEQRIFKECQRTDIVCFEDNVLQNLNPTAFLIWPERDVLRERLATDANEGEQLILKLSLPVTPWSEGTNLLVFRTGITTLRIVRPKFIDRCGAHYGDDPVNIHHDRFTPFYAVAESSGPSRRPSSLSPTSNLSIYRANATGAVDFELKDEADMFQFQRAITGYQVVFDKTTFWAFKHSRNVPQGRSRFQLWHWKPLEEISTDGTPVSSPSASIRSPMSETSRTSGAVIDRVFARTNTTLLTVNQEANTDANLTVFSTTPPHPVMIIYARNGSRYSYYHIELNFGLQIVPTTCLCNTQPGRCTVSVIECRQNSSVQKFLVRKLSVPTSKLSDLNISIFSQPRHPSFNNRKIVEQIDNVKMLKLDFDSIEDRQEFTKKFNMALKKRDEAEIAYQKMHQTIRFEGEKLGQVAKAKPPSKTLFKSPTSTNLQPPMLNPLSRFSTLTLGEEGNQIFELASPVHEMGSSDSASAQWTRPNPAEYPARSAWR